MIGYIDSIRKTAHKLLSENHVDCVLGFQQGSLPMMNTPFLCTRPEATDQLVWDAHCGINLTTYLIDRTDKVAIIAKGCDSRNIITHLIENKIKREQIFIIGVPCKGMADKDKIKAHYTASISEVKETDNAFIVTGNTGEKSFSKEEVLQDNCRICTHRNPVIYDTLVAESLPEQKNIDRYADIHEIENLSANQKWHYFEKLLAPCTRCYACRNACPLCYCPTCFVDDNNPQWLGKSQDPIDIRTFHFLRAFHCAGRCTDCGACERACPQGIKVRQLTKKLEKECYEQFGWEAGLSLNERPPLDTFKRDDPEPFIK